MSRRDKNNLKRDAKLISRNMAGRNLGPAEGEPAVALGWASDFCELADAIADPRVSVTNRDRDCLARNLPPGCLTNRYGESARPVFRSEAAA